MLKMDKNAISPVVATALLLVVAVVAVVGFQNWFGTYSSDLFVQTEKGSSSTSNTNIETLVGNQLYFKNTQDSNISIKQIKIGNKECNISVNLTNGVHNISLGDCVKNLTSQINDITVITDNQVYTKKHLFKDVKNNVVSLNYNYSWITGSWSQCNSSQNIGYQNRSVQCQRNDSLIVDDSFCLNIKPVLNQTCTPGIDSYTVLLIQSNTTNGNVTFVDSLGSHTITRNGNTQHLTSESKFGTSSIYFDGSGDYLSIPDSNDWDFGTENFTIDAWIYPTGWSGSNYQYITSQWQSGNPWVQFGLVNSGTICFEHSGTQFTGTSASLNLWQHMAIVRNKNIIKMYINGIEASSNTFSGGIDNVNSLLWIGAAAPSYHYFKGYIDELRISKGVARWTENFTPPIEPYK